MNNNIKLPPLPVSANFYGMYGEYTKSQVEALMREAVRLNAQAVPDGYALVPVDAMKRWRDAFAEELSAWDIDPPLHHVQTSHDEIEAMLSAAPAAPQPRDDGMPESSDERHLRRLLAVRVAMPNTYFDDGEAHGAEHGIQIDFMREPVAHIDAKLRALNVARLAVAAPRPAQQPLTDARFQKIRRSLMQQSGWDGKGWDQALKEAIEQAHGIGVKND